MTHFELIELIAIAYFGAALILPTFTNREDSHND